MTNKASGRDTHTTSTSQADRVCKMRRREERFEKQLDRKRHAPAVLLDFIPDDLQDSKYERTQQAKRMFGDGDGLACRLLSATDHRLKFTTVPLGPGTPAELYSHKTNKHARTISRAVFGRSPVWTKLELGLDGGLHLHMLGAADAPLMLPKGSNVQDVKPTDADYRRVLGYMSKPADARACLVKYGPQRYSEKANRTLLAEAILDYQLARVTAGRLPRLTWTHNLPQLKPDAALIRPA
jgi:hypothetical protein